MFDVSRWILAAVLSLGFAQTAQAGLEALGCRSAPCRVTFNGGGELSSFVAAAQSVRGTSQRVVIDGPCYSACAIFADQARENVCVTRRARFGFHKGYKLSLLTGSNQPVILLQRFEPRHSPDISRWIKNHGGFPSQGFLVMGGADAQRIWRQC